MYGYLCLCIAIFKQQKTFSVCIAPYKHERRWENSRQLCKPETKQRVCITVENSPNASSVYIRLCKHRKKVFCCFYKVTFPRKKRRTLCMALIKREILTIRKILSTKSCTRNQFLFCKKVLCKIRIFLVRNAGLSKEKLTHLLCNDFPYFNRRRNG